MNKLLTHITITKIGHGGVWLATLPDGKTIIVKGGVLPWSVVDLKIVKSKKDYIECHVVTVYHMDPARSSWTIKCPHYLFHPDRATLPVHKSGCGGCKRQILDYDHQLLTKQQIVIDSFHHLSDVIDTIGWIPLPLWSPEFFGYRNKIEFSFGKYITSTIDANGTKKKTVESDRSVGFHRQGQFAKIIDIDACYLVDSQINHIFTYCKKFLQSLWLPVYDQKTHQWVLRHLMMRQGKHTDQVMVVLSLSDTQFSPTAWKQFVEDVKSDSTLTSLVTTLVIVINNGLADIIYDRESHQVVLRWEGCIDEELHIVSPISQIFPSPLWSPTVATFRISPTSFFQTNTLGAELLFQTAYQMIVQHIPLLSHRDILDLYCGTGTIGIIMSKLWLGQRLIGIDSVASAIIDAQSNALRNGIADAYFVSGRAEQIVGSDPLIPYASLGLIIVDPPREWLHSDMTQYLIELKNKSDFGLCYISCNPVTLARDISLLITWWYTLVALQPVDMFPHTHHIETIAILR